LQKQSKIILGIDPGTVVMGYGIIEVKDNKISLVEMSTLRLSSKKDTYERLQLIHACVTELIKKFHPGAFAIEAPFFGKNVQSMLKLGRAQGVAIAAAMQASIPVTEYSPKKVKQSITGNGNADKEQVWKMLQRLMTATSQASGFDASDALAVAVCHHFQSSSPLISTGTKSKGWDDFAKKNTARVISTTKKLP
jgi:crossover junction endodeoxyribonuclease RuvC